MDEYKYLVLDCRSHITKSEPIMGYFKTRKDAEDNADRRNAHVNDPYGMNRYIVYEVEDYE